MKSFNPALTAITITGSVRKNTLDSLLARFGLAGALTETATGWLLDWEMRRAVTEEAITALKDFCLHNGLGFEEVDCLLFRTIQAPKVYVIASANCGGMFHYQVIKSFRPEIFREDVRERMSADTFLSVFENYGIASECSLVKKSLR